jgi:hypothetical protein
VKFFQQNPGVQKIKQAWNENPIGVAIVAGGVLTAVSKTIDAIAGFQSKRAYAKNRGKRR